MHLKILGEALFHSKMCFDTAEHKNSAAQTINTTQREFGTINLFSNSFGESGKFLWVEGMYPQVEFLLSNLV